MDIKKQTHNSVWIWFAWALASAVGWAVAFPIQGDFIWPWGWLISGTLAGMLQVILLRGRLGSSTTGKWWGLASIIGWMGGSLVVGTISRDMPDVTSLTIIFAAGIPVGLLQGLTLWTTLRGRITTVVTWIVANVLGIGMAVTASIMVSQATGYADSLITQVMLGGLFGMVQGTITGGALISVNLTKDRHRSQIRV